MSGAAPAMRLATEIAAQFRHISADDAADRIASHIRTYWDPRMRAQLIEQVSSAGSACDAYVRAAAARLG